MSQQNQNDATLRCEEKSKGCAVCGARGCHCDSAARYVAALTGNLAIPLSDPVSHKAVRAISAAIGQMWRDHAREHQVEVAP